MTEIVDFIAEPWGEAFMQRALVVLVVSSVVSGVIGCHVVLRGMAFIGDAVSHAVFPGVAVAFVLQANMVTGGMVGGLVVSVLIALLSQNRRLREDAVIGVFWAASFGLGIVVLSTAPGYSGSLESFLFGQIVGIGDDDVVTALVTGPVLLLVALLLHKELVAVSLDRETASVAGLPVFWLDVVLYTMVTSAIVISLQAVGNVLVLALLITPAASARLLTDRLGTMMLLAPLIGAGSSIVGLYVSYHNNLATGGVIVLVVTGVFLAVWTFAPKHGLVVKAHRRRRVPAAT